MMFSSSGALLCFNLFTDVLTSDSSMDGGSLIEVAVGSPCKI